MFKFYNWNSINERAYDKPFGSRELTAKDNARAYFEQQFDLSDEESIEGAIDSLVDTMKEEPLFDPDGNFVCMYNTKGNKWRFTE